MSGTGAGGQIFNIGKTQGKLIDKESKAPLEAATVFAESIGDSTLVTYTITDKDGEYSLIGRTSLEEVNVFVSFVGYIPYEQRVSLKNFMVVVKLEKN